MAAFAAISPQCPQKIAAVCCGGGGCGGDFFFDRRRCKSDLNREDAMNRQGIAAAAVNVFVRNEKMFRQAVLQFEGRFVLQNCK